MNNTFFLTNFLGVFFVLFFCHENIVTVYKTMISYSAVYGCNRLDESVHFECDSWLSYGLLVKITAFIQSMEEFITYNKNIW